MCVTFIELSRIKIYIHTDKCMYTRGDRDKFYLKRRSGVLKHTLETEDEFAGGKLSTQGVNSSKRF